MTDKNESPRQMLNTADPNAIRIVYRTPIDPVMKKCLCFMGAMDLCSGILCKRNEIYESTYVQVHENRVEFNYPGLKTMPCCRSIRDSIQVYYFDDSRIAKVAKAGCCEPACTHNSCCPTLCGLYGEMAIFTNNRGCCCKRWFSVPFLVSADAFIQQVEQAKTARQSFTGGSVNAGVAPGVMSMEMPATAGTVPMGTPMAPPN